MEQLISWAAWMEELSGLWAHSAPLPHTNFTPRQEKCLFVSLCLPSFNHSATSEEKKRACPLINSYSIQTQQLSLFAWLLGFRPIINHSVIKRKVSFLLWRKQRDKGPAERSPKREKKKRRKTNQIQSNECFLGFIWWIGVV